MDRYIRTDLALELKDDIKHNYPEGIKVYTHKEANGKIIVTRIEVENTEGEKALGKPVGTYITLESRELGESDESIHEPLMKLLYSNLRLMIRGKEKLLVVGLGNKAVTPDALGPYVVDNLYITRHLLNEGIVKEVREISAICPGVMAQTGIESSTILKALCDEIKPDVVIAVDALAAREPSRLNSTIQICDTGISPGAGVGNNRIMLNENTLGVRVIAIGVPTVISVPSIAYQAIDKMLMLFSEERRTKWELNEEEKYRVAEQLLEPDLSKMFVTPKNIDEAVKRISYTISEAINKFFEL